MNIISFEDFLKEENAILIDVRTPKEFLLEKIPNSVNIPVLLDEERVAVGTTYVQRSKESAKKMGIDVFYPSMKLCTDNAAMIAEAAYYKLINCKDGKSCFADLDLNGVATLNVIDD